MAMIELKHRYFGPTFASWCVACFCSSQNKRQAGKKINLPTNTSLKPIDDSITGPSTVRKDGISPTNTNYQPNGDRNFDTSTLTRDNNSDSDQEADSSDNFPVIIHGYPKEEGYNNSSQPDEVGSMHSATVDSAEGSVHSNDEIMSSSFPSNSIPVCHKFPSSV